MLTQSQVTQLNDDFGLPNVKLLIIFSHGKESGPRGKKISLLADIGKKFGASIIIPDYSDLLLPELRVDRLLSLNLPAHHKLILVGSSMGGYVSIVASKKLYASGLFLMAPAIGLAGYSELMPDIGRHATTIIHGWNDKIVPVENVFNFSELHKADLHILDADHDLHSCLDQIEYYFTVFLEKQIKD